MLIYYHEDITSADDFDGLGSKLSLSYSRTSSSVNRQKQQKAYLSVERDSEIVSLLLNCRYHISLNFKLNTKT